MSAVLPGDTAVPDDSPKSWEFCCGVARDPELCRIFWRSPEDRKRYTVFKQMVQRTYLSITDKILIVDFGCKSTKVLNQDGFMVLKGIIDESTPHKLWMPNQYPCVCHHSSSILGGRLVFKSGRVCVLLRYHVEKGISHYLLFSLEPMESDQIDQWLSDKLDPSQWEFVWFVNVPGKRSVPGIFHAQVMFRQRRNNQSLII